MEPIQFLMLGGAAGALFWVLKLAVDGKLHTSSETDGLRQDKVDLLKINETQGQALKASNEQGTEIVTLLRGVLQELRDLRGEDPDGPA